MTRAAMVVERFWPRALPLLVLVSLFVSLSWFAAFRLMPDMLRFVVLAVLGLAALASLWPLRSFRMPTPTEVDRRIERANRLEHAPVSTQTDRLAAGGESAFATALWREHQKRMADRLGGLSGDLPRTGIPERDPWGMRAFAALLLVTAFAFSLGPDGGSLTDAFRPGGGRPAVPARIDAWVTPPTYTGRAPIFLTAEAYREAQHFMVPADSAVSVRVTGGSGEETLSFTDASGTATAVEPDNALPAESDAAATGALQFSRKLTGDGTLSLHSAGTARDWAFTVVPDEAPTIRFARDPQRAANGTLELAYEIEDDYGAAKAEADFKLADPPAPGARPLYEAPELALALPPRGGHEKAAKTTRDLTRHPWAGSNVELTLEARDDAGHAGRSGMKSFVLPERPFTNPLARALIEDRRILALDANEKGRVLALLDAVLLWPEETIGNMVHFLAVSSARSRLDIARTDDQFRGVVDYLWDIALNIENGDLSDAQKRLRQAQQALKDALKNGADAEEIDKLMKELRQAMQDYLREFAERAMQNPDMARQMPQDMQTLSQRDIDRMLDKIEELAKSGSRDKAEQLLSQLENMMNNLRAGRQQQGRQSGEQSEMRQQMDKLGEIMRRQQETMNETFALGQQQRRGDNPQGQQGEPGQQGQGRQGEQGEGQQGQGMTPQEFAEAMRRLRQGQGQLRQDLQGLMKGLENLGIQPGEGFGEAGQAMGEAEGALGEQNGEAAVGEQGRALEALRRGAQDMMNQMQQAMRGERGGGQEGGRQQQADRDPLGRPRATTGPDFGDSVKVPDEIDIQRARRILEAIRKRLGDALSPEIERSYLERLLNMN